MKTYYENVNKLDGLRILTLPSESDLKKVFEIIKDDVELSLYFYDVLEPGWVELLDKAGEFEELREKETRMFGKYKAHYLKQSAEAKAEAVLGIIEKLEAQDINIQGTLIRAIVKMPEETAIKGIGVVTKYLDEREYKLWYGIGEVAAELMVNLMANHPDKAFEVAEALLDAWVSEKKTYGKDIVVKFSEDEYSKLMLEHYSKVWDANPERAIGVLIKILNRCLETLDDKEDASISFGYGLELGDLDKIDMNHPSIKTILVKGICEAGKVLIDKEPGKISEFLDLLEGTNRVIFLRIAMYLLRSVKPGTEKERISKFVGNKEYFKEYNPCWNEHRQLLNDKFDDASDKDKKAFLEWVKEDKYSEDQRKEVAERYKRNNEAEPDFEKWENFAKAEQLYLVSERFKDEYERYKKAAGVKNDSELAPRKMVSEARLVSPKEGTPLTSEEMAKMSPGQILEYVLNPKNYEESKRKDTWRSAADGLAATLKEDAKKRSSEYLECDIGTLTGTPERFLSSLLYGIQDAVRDESFDKESWERFLEVSFALAEQKGKDKKYKNCFRAIVGALRDSFSEQKNAIEFDESMAKSFSQILTILVHFPTDDMKRFMKESQERDPVQLMCNVVAGEALDLTISLGIAVRTKLNNYWENNLRSQMRDCWEFALNNIREPGVNCVFGLEFSRLHWLDEDLTKKKLDDIFSKDLWNEVWGTYTSWGRPSPNGFKLLVEKGKYEQAVDILGTENNFKYGKDPEEGLVEHLMIGYFNGWISLKDSVLVKFFEKAPAKLRGEAAHFLTTGFKPVNEEDKPEEKEKVAERMREYWNKRIAVIKDKPKENIDESIELTGWVCDSVLPAKETLELLEQSLDLSGGKVGKMRGARDFVEGVTKLGEGNEMLALRCLKKGADDKEVHMPWSSIQEPLVNFLEKMVNMPKEVRSVAIEVADAYGRYNPDKFRGVWEKLNESKNQS